MSKENLVSIVVKVPKDALDLTISSLGYHDADIVDISIAGHKDLLIDVEMSKALSSYVLEHMAKKLAKGFNNER